MLPHFMQSARLGHFNHLLWEHRDSIDWKNRWPLIARTYGYAAFLQLPGLVERGLYHRRIQNTPVEKPPLFILGHWRSGTTFLFNLLSLDPETAYMDSVDTFTFDHVLTMSPLLYPYFNKALDGSRPGDTLEWLAESPQEEAYTLANMLDCSCAHMITFPQDAEKYIHLNHAARMSPRQRQEWAECHKYILKKMTLLKGNRRILFKSPDNTAKLGLLRDIYPPAKFVNIYRDPYKVLLSTLNMFRVGVPALCFQPLPSEEWMEDMAIMQFKLMYQQYFRDCQSIPQNQLVEVAYSDLVKAPLETLEHIYTRLELPGFEAAKPLFLAHINSQKSYQPNRFQIEPRLQRKINAELGEYFEHYHFPLRDCEAGA